MPVITADQLQKQYDVVIVGSGAGGGQTAYTLTMEGGFLAALPAIQRELPAHLIRGLYYLENWEDMDGYEPDIYVDTTEVFDQYCEALSHFALWNGGTGWPYADYYKSLARMRGCLGFGLKGKYAATLARPRDAKTIRTDGLP